MGDLTGGQVEMVDLQALSTNVGAILANTTLATHLKITVIAGDGISLGGQCHSERKGAARVTTVSLGSISSKTDLTFNVQLPEDSMKLVDHSVPFQIHLQYNRSDGEEVLQVFQDEQLLCSDREAAESNVDSICIALRGIHSAACLAQQGEYR